MNIIKQWSRVQSIFVNIPCLEDSTFLHNTNQNHFPPLCTHVTTQETLKSDNGELKKKKTSEAISAELNSGNSNDFFIRKPYMNKSLWTY